MASSIGIPGIFREDQCAGGVYSVFANLLRGFTELLDESPAPDPFKLTVFHGRVAPPNKDSRFHWRRVSDRLGRFAAETRIAAYPGCKLDALLLLNYHTPPVIRASRAVTIVHDLLYLHMPEYCSRQKLAWLKWCYALALKKCHRVVTISGAVKQDMLRLYGERWSDRIEVIWNPVSVDRFAPGAEANFTNGRPYILCVSVDRPPKNLYRLIKAYALVRQKFPDHCLVLAGQLRTQRRDWRERSATVDETMPAAADLVDQLALHNHVCVTGFIPDEQLGALYRGATMCVLPSLFEGFGMPAVESLAMGKPTLVSGLPVLREVTLGAAYYIDDPTNIDAMADSISAILDHPASFQPAPELVDRVRERFSPREIARQYLQVLTA